MEQFTVSCEWCLIDFTTHYETKKYCSREHKEQAREYRKHGRSRQAPELRTATPVWARQCLGCTIPFITTKEVKVYCSAECSEMARRRRKDKKDRQSRQKKSPSIKARIYFRDNGMCQICGDKIDVEEKYPSPFSLSLDHIVPRSQGGTDAHWNLRATHLVCNVRRSDGTRPPTKAYESVINPQDAN